MIFEVQSGDKTYEVDAPDQDTAIKSLQSLIANVKPQGGAAVGTLAGASQAAAGAAEAGQPSAAEDIAGSAASRVAAGALDIPGTFGDLASLADRAGSAAAQGIMSLAGVAPEKRQQAQAAADAYGRPLQFLPGSEDVKKAVGFEAYQPKTEAGQTFDKYVGTGLEMVPSLAVGGGIKKAADVARYALAPAAAGEVAGDATKGTAIEPWARLGAMFLTGAAAGRTVPKKAGASAPTVDELKAQSQALYDQARRQGIAVKPEVLDAAIGDITKTAAGFGIDPTIHPKSFAALKRLQEFSHVPPVGGVRTVANLEDIDMMRQILGDAASTMDKADAMRAFQMRDKLDSFVAGLKPGDVFGGADPRAAVNTLLKARSLWARKAKGEVIGELFRRAELSAPNFSGSGAENAIRAEFRLFAKNQKRMRQFSADERAAIERVAKGGPVGNLLRFIGKAAPTGIVSAGIGSGAGATVGAAFGVPGIGALAVPAVGLAARKAATVSTLRKARAADELVRGGKGVKATRQPTPFAPMSVVFGAATERTSDKSK